MEKWDPRSVLDPMDLDRLAWLTRRIEKGLRCVERINATTLFQPYDDWRLQAVEAYVEELYTQRLILARKMHRQVRAVKEASVVRILTGLAKALVLLKACQCGIFSPSGQPGDVDTTIPDHELELLINTVTEAVDHATEGRTSEGYQSLAYGLERARGLEEPWAPELIQRYQQALQAYAEEHFRNGVRH